MIIHVIIIAIIYIVLLVILYISLLSILFIHIIKNLMIKKWMFCHQRNAFKNKFNKCIIIYHLYMNITLTYNVFNKKFIFYII